MPILLISEYIDLVVYPRPFYFL